MSRVGIMLRFRDLVTEPRGNSAEHRRLMNELGFAWWGFGGSDVLLIKMEEGFGVRR